MKRPRRSFLLAAALVLVCSAARADEGAATTDSLAPVGSGAPAASGRKAPPDFELDGRLSAQLRVEGVELKGAPAEIDQSFQTSVHAKLTIRSLPFRPIAFVVDADWFEEVTGRLTLGRATGDLMDTYHDGRRLFLRSAYVDLPGSFHEAVDLRVGRQTVWAIVPVRFDGAEGRVRLGRDVELEAYGGRLATLYEEYVHALVAGGEVLLRPVSGLTVTLRDQYLDWLNFFEFAVVERPDDTNTISASTIFLDEKPFEARFRYDLRPPGAPFNFDLNFYSKLLAENRWGQRDLQFDYLRKGDEKGVLYSRYVLGYLKPHAQVDARATYEVVRNVGLSILGGVRYLYDHHQEDAFNGSAFKTGAGFEVRDLPVEGSRIAASYSYWHDIRDVLDQRRHVLDASIGQRVSDRLRFEAWIRYQAGQLEARHWDGFAAGTQAAFGLAYGVSLVLDYQYEWDGLLETYEGIHAWHRGTMELRWDF